MSLSESCCWALFPAHWDQAASDEGERLAGNLEFVPASMTRHSQLLDVNMFGTWKQRTQVQIERDITLTGGGGWRSKAPWKFFWLLGKASLKTR
jgi:hypothetical protein